MKLPRDGITETLPINFPYRSCNKACYESSYEAEEFKRVFNRVLLMRVIAAYGISAGGIY